MKNKMTLFLKEPFGFILYFFDVFVNRSKLKFKNKFLRSRYNISSSVKFHNNTYVYGNGKIIIGDNTHFGKNTFVVSNPVEATIEIGENCRISHGCHFRTEDSDPHTLYLKKPVKISKNIKIGNNCWIGANSFIRAGVTLGNNLTVGANSVVTKSFGDNVVIAGVPAKVIKVL